jgi:hypothetical protein
MEAINAHLINAHLINAYLIASCDLCSSRGDAERRAW